MSKVPAGWRKVSLGKHIDLLSGFPFKSSEYTDLESDIKLLRGDNVEPGKLRWRNVKRWSAQDIGSLDKFQLKANDVIVAMDRTWVSSGLKIAKVEQNDLPCLLVQRVARLRGLKTLDGRLIKQFLSSYEFEQYVKSVQTETAVPHISALQIKEFPILLPPLPEQRKIAKILSTWDKAIAVTEALIAASEEEKRGLMQDLLTGKRRFGGFEGAWRRANIGSLFDVIYGKSPKEVISANGKYPIIGTGGVNGYSDVALCNEPSVIIGRKGTLDKPQYITTPFWAIDTVFYSVPKADSECDIKWFYYALSLMDLKQYNEASGVPSLSRQAIESLLLKIPSLPEQEKIAAVLSAADREIELLREKLGYLKEEKKGLMQELLTGRRRVVVDEEVAMVI